MSEEPNPNIPTWPDKAWFIAHRALLITGQKITQKDSFTSEEAVRLASLYLSYRAEMALYSQDTRQRLNDQSNAELSRERRMKAEAALFVAHVNGDYTALKEHIRDIAKEEALIGDESQDCAVFPLNVRQSGKLLWCLHVKA